MKKRVEVVRKMREDEERRGVGRQLTKRRVWTGKLSGGVDNGGSEIEEKGDEKNEKEGVEETEGQTNEDEDDTNEVRFNRTSLVAEQVLDQEGEVEEEGASNAEAGDQNATDEESDEEGEEGSDDTVRPRPAVDTTRNDEEESGGDTDTEETIGVVRPSTTTAIPKARPRRPLKRSRGPEEEEEPPTPVAGPSSEVDRRPVRSRRRL
ncbi:hypothetical protein BDN72DRAFT_849555 [Pluteus cervinus]|uniref:Uncharacterized protein n=1 Tax=Pluteus cervinus TaxID=181527 RepID=A0ACD3A9P8_9AGAR|nr:hypothetical protein BDN72DRAFT_849555 [Pluteus cervinus]